MIIDKTINLTSTLQLIQFCSDSHTIKPAQCLQLINMQELIGVEDNYEMEVELYKDYIDARGGLNSEIANYALEVLELFKKSL